MSPLRIVFMGTPDFAVPCLNMLVNEGYEVQAVVSQPDRPKGRGQKLTASPVKEAALAANLPVLTPERIRETSFVDKMKELDPDMIIVVAFGQFLPKTMLDIPRFGCINVHASLLPQYRGAAPIHWAIINGETKTGITTMFMDVGMDTGDMLLKAELPIGKDDTTGDLHEALKELGASILSETIRGIAKGTIARKPQDHQLATYAPLLTRETEKINWMKPAQDIHNLVRGLNPWPGSYCLHRGKNLKIWKTRLSSESLEVQPGQLLLIHETVLVGTGSGCLELVDIQPESKKRMAAVDYFRGHSNSGDNLLE